MAVTVDMRKDLAEAYSSAAWQDKVSKMSDKQVTAIYLRLKAQGKI